MTQEELTSLEPTQTIHRAVCISKGDTNANLFWSLEEEPDRNGNFSVVFDIVATDGGEQLFGVNSKFTVRFETILQKFVRGSVREKAAIEIDIKPYEGHVENLTIVEQFCVDVFIGDIADTVQQSIHELMKEIM